LKNSARHTDVVSLLTLSMQLTRSEHTKGGQNDRMAMLESRLPQADFLIHDTTILSWRKRSQ